ncbi:hypothetical protein KC19_VG155600 [Ceratodon purpureus]|uniref:Uncharacterized protein n=1 Tax=Ceratodon purpureus TaxID=3225 RepID=A0A8T0HRJ3_CERPU|nr:hypothetical protein KC19_VG155600 [Ceratodon purpureus]
MFIITTFPTMLLIMVDTTFVHMNLTSTSFTTNIFYPLNEPTFYLFGFACGLQNTTNQHL